jgi:hypothetical protein
MADRAGAAATEGRGGVPNLKEEALTGRNDAKNLVRDDHRYKLQAL